MQAWKKRLAFAGRTLRDEALFQLARVAEVALRPVRQELILRLRWGKKLSLAIKITARPEKREEWGDFHFAESLKDALERRGHRARIDFPAQWYEAPAVKDDVVLVLRGLTAYAPAPGPVNVMWNISHPDQVSYEEYESYDLIFVASLSYPSFLRTVIKTPVLPLLQATDARRFRPWPLLPKTKEILFVGNSRNQFRPIVRWAIQAGLRPTIYGAAWKRFVAKDLVKGRNIDNRSLSMAYARAAVVLNDHWDSMRQFGFVSNRVFDVLASGGSLVSDSMPSIDRIFGRDVRQAHDPASLAGAVAAARKRKGIRHSLRRAAEIRRKHSFDDRASQILAATRAVGSTRTENARGKAQLYLPAPSLARRRPLKLAVLLSAGREQITRSEYLRLISPLTSEALSGHIETTIFAAGDWRQTLHSDAVVLQPDCVLTGDLDISAGLRKSRTRLIVDLDGSPPEQCSSVSATRSPEILSQLLQEADQSWWSTAPIKDGFAGRSCPSHLIPTSMDSRIWRDFRAEPKLAAEPTARLLLLARNCDEAPSGALLEALDALADTYPGRFSLTIVGPQGKPFDRPWLAQVAVPDACASYPRFARWLRTLGTFHVGVAPYHDTAVTPDLSELCLTYWALGALPISIERVPTQYGSGVTLSLSAENSAERWSRTLEPIISSPATIDSRRLAGYNHLWTNCSADQTALIQLQLLQTIL